MEIIGSLAILVALLNSLAVQVWMCWLLHKERIATVPAEPRDELTQEELEARQKAAEAQAKYEQGFVNLMSYDGMPAKKRKGVFE